MEQNIPCTRHLYLARANDFVLKFLQEYRLGISIAAVFAIAFVILFNEPHRRWDGILDTWGSLLMVAGAAFRLWALGYISGNKNRRIVQEGPYRFTRNPLYFGSLLFGLGMCLLGGSFTAALLFIAFFVVVYGAAMRVEEQDLEQKFGEDFRRYRLAVPMFVPAVSSPLPKGNASFRIKHWKRELATLVFLCVAVYVVTEFTERIHLRYNLPDWFE